MENGAAIEAFLTDCGVVRSGCDPVLVERVRIVQGGNMSVTERIKSLILRVMDSSFDIGPERLIHASKRGDINSVQNWLRAGVSPNSKSRVSRGGWLLAGDTALGIAARTGHFGI